MNASDTITERPRRLAGLRHRGESFGSSAERPPHRELVRRELADYAARIGLTDLVREHGSPLLVLDTDRVTTQLLELRRELPEVAIHYAVTALSHPAVIRAVDAFGASFAVASRGEIDLLEREGVAIGRCLHVHPVKSVADLTGSYLRGIRTFVVDSAAEIAKFAGLPRDVSVLVRLAHPDAVSPDDASWKFGVAPHDAAALVEQCLRAGLHVAGFSFHLGARAASPSAWQHAIRRTLELMGSLERTHRIRFEVLDLGGGLPVGNGGAGHDLKDVARGIRSALASAPTHLTVIMEPGRFVAAPAMTLVARVIGTAMRPDGRWHHLDGGSAGANREVGVDPEPGLVFAASELDVQPIPEGATERATRRRVARALVPVTLAGPALDRGDILARRCPLPPLVDGDLVVRPMMGAYRPAPADGLAPTRIVVVPV